MSKKLTQLSKFVALMLRHKPDDFGLELDKKGFVDVEAVWKQVKKNYGTYYSRTDFNNMIYDTKSGQQRYEVVDGKVRALYGHSAVEVEYSPVRPPKILYHGTVRRSVQSIRQYGLTGQKRQYVHLSSDTHRASDVAQRRGKPILLLIRALEAHNAGLEFYNPEPKHFLVKHVPPEFIDFPGD